MSDAVNDNEPPPVMLIIGRVRAQADGEAVGIQIMLTAPDDDSAVLRALDALRQRGYTHAELDQIGEVEEAPDEEPQLSAYQGALEGEVSLVLLGSVR
jgi:hypothetical protein